MTGTEHATFVIEREYGARPEQVFRAWADVEAKSRWFGPRHDGGAGIEMDFEVGGHERFVAGGPDGARYTYDATFMDIVADRRIVYAYEMLRDANRISVSLTTVEIEPVAEGAKLIYTEQAAYLDGHDTPAQREHGTRELLERLGETLVTA